MRLATTVPKTTIAETMAKDDTLQLRIDAQDMRYLRLASQNSQMSLSDFMRRQLEPSIVAAKIADIAKDFSFITSVKLFGSMARSEQTDTSDIDIAIARDYENGQEEAETRYSQSASSAGVGHHLHERLQ